MQYFNGYKSSLFYNYLYVLPQNFNIENEYSEYKFDDNCWYYYDGKHHDIRIFMYNNSYSNYTKSWLMNCYRDSRYDCRKMI